MIETAEWGLPVSADFTCDYDVIAVLLSTTLDLPTQTPHEVLDPQIISITGLFYRDLLYSKSNLSSLSRPSLLTKTDAFRNSLRYVTPT